MANIIKIKRGLKANILDVTLEMGELAYCYDTGELYIGNGSGKQLLISNYTLAGEAEKLTNPRQFSITGDGTAAAIEFDGTANVALNLVLAASGIVAGTYTKTTFDAQGRAIHGEALVASDIPELTLSKITDAGTSASHDVGVASGNIPVLDSTGKLSQSVLPSLSVTDIFPVTSQAEMLGLSNAEQGDVAIRLDEKKTYILMQSPASTLANWSEFLSPDSPVQSVNGQIGTVIIDNITGNAGTATALESARLINGVSFDGTENITIVDATKEPIITSSTENTYWNGLKQFVDFATSVRNAVLTGLSVDVDTPIVATDTVVQAFGKAQAQISTKAPLESPIFVGAPIAPTATSSTNNQQIATTAFVKNQGYLDSSSIIDGGTF